MTLRTVKQIIPRQKTTEGAGVRLFRTIGSRALDHLDPFLLLDEFKSEEGADTIAGFPDHPHRGFETVTYMLAGAMQHKDHMGNEGNLKPGSVQWMTAGRGVVHSEMPQQEDGLLWGFQLWVNLPASDKLCPARYQDIPPEAVPEVDLPGGVRVRVLAGRAGGHEGAVLEVATNPLYLDVRVPEAAEFESPVPSGHSAFVYVFDGSAEVAGEVLPCGSLAVLTDGDSVNVRAAKGGPARFLLAAARPLGEPIARYGPFVMNTADEIAQAISDFQSGRLTD